MKRLLATLLIASLATGCATTHRRVQSAPTTRPEDNQSITGVILLDGTEIAFTGHGELDPAGFVLGRVPLDGYTGLAPGAEATRTVRYPMTEIDQLVLDEKEKKADAVGIVLLVVAAVGLALLVNESMKHMFDDLDLSPLFFGPIY